MYFKWFSNEFEFLHYMELGIHFYYDSCSTDTEMSDVISSIIYEFLYSYKSCAYCISWAIEDCVAVTEFRRIFNHSHPLALIFHTIYR
jgi:hypothetical protein